MSIRAGIVVTGTEVLTGRVADANGPWLAERLRELGVDVGHVVVVGDRPDDLHAALGFLAGTGVPLVVTGELVSVEGRRATATARVVAEDAPEITLAEGEATLVALRADRASEVFSRTGRDVGAWTSRS